MVVSERENSYVGFTEIIFSPDFDFTNSLLMNKPIGWVYLSPFGAVNSTCRSAIFGVREVLRETSNNGVREEFLCVHESTEALYAWWQAS